MNVDRHQLAPFRTSRPSENQQDFGSEEHDKPHHSHSEIHPQQPSFPNPTASSPLRQPQSYLRPPFTERTYTSQPGRSGSTDYYTDSSNASAASSGGRPPQSTVSSGSSHTNVRVEAWAGSQAQERPSSTGLESNDRAFGYYPLERSRFPLSNARGSSRTLALERRESSLRQRSRQPSAGSSSTLARDRSTSPVSGNRTPPVTHHADASYHQSLAQYC